MKNRFEFLKQRRLVLLLISVVAALLSAKGVVNPFGFWDGPSCVGRAAEYGQAVASRDGGQCMRMRRSCTTIAAVTCAS